MSNSKFKKIFFILSVFLSFRSYSQVFTPNPDDFKDGIYEKSHTNDKKFIPYTYLREADLTWEKRVWREIDMREKLNQTLYYPIEQVRSRISLFQTLVKYIKTGEIVAFDDQEFIKPLDKNELTKTKLFKCDSMSEKIVDENGNETEGPKTLKCDTTSIFSQIRKYKLKEDWFFDKQKSVMEVRIIGLGVFTYDEEKGADRELFWVYFPSCRPYFAKHEVYNTKNDAERRTYDDIFWKRQFNSTITKENNVFDRNINEYAKGMDALIENERIKNEIFKYEHDFWQF